LLRRFHYATLIEAAAAVIDIFYIAAVFMLISISLRHYMLAAISAVSHYCCFHYARHCESHFIRCFRFGCRLFRFTALPIFAAFARYVITRRRDAMLFSAPYGFSLFSLRRAS